MADPFVAEIRIFGFNFPPKGWAFCNGQLLPLSQNTALFSLLGTFYGGDGKSTFALPNLQGSAPMFWGSGSGLSQHFIGEQSGTENVTLLVSEMPFHTHTLQAFATPADLKEPQDGAVLTRTQDGALYNTTISNLQTMAPQALTPAGGSLPHNNMMPYLALNFCIAMQGVFPPRQ
ncbi:MAG TPA: tail fiber protein [Thermoanaerobaculia bacterium]|jgi:microcystin-dependent protein